MYTVRAVVHFRFLVRFGFESACALSYLVGTAKFLVCMYFCRIISADAEGRKQECGQFFTIEECELQDICTVCVHPYVLHRLIHILAVLIV